MVIKIGKLKETEKLINQYVTVTKNNFLKIGSLLKQIRDYKLYLEDGHETWIDYLNSDKFEFSERHAYKLIDVYEKFGKLPLAATLGFNKLIELTHVTDKEVREDLTKEAVKEDLSRTEIKEEVQKVNAEVIQLTEKKQDKKMDRFWERQDNDLEVKQDSAEEKCNRQGQEIMDIIQDLIVRLKKNKASIEMWLAFSKKFETENIKALQAAIYTKLEELKRI